jgi:hypothetical protein
MGWIGRLRQVWYYLRPSWRNEDRAWAAEHLGIGGLTLFDAMGTQDRAHAVRVARRLAAQDAPAWVIEAALLHDCGKPAEYGLFWRSVGVILARSRLQSRGLEIYRKHDEWTLIAVRGAAISVPALALLQAYNAKEQGDQPWLASLRVADDLG